MAAQAEAAGRLVEACKTVTDLENELIKAVAIAERWRQQAEGAARRADNLLAELYELTCEHVEMYARHEALLLFRDSHNT